MNNFKKKRSISSQVATLLILMITVILIFVLVVVNIGQVSNYATNLSNAVDAGSLYLASQLATKSFQLSESLVQSCGNPVKCCQKTGFLSVILAIVVAIIAMVTWQYWLLPVLQFVGITVTTATAVTAAVITAGIIGGSVGGAIGGAIAGTGALQGAIQGAMIGGSIAAGIELGFIVGPKIGLGGILAEVSILGTVSYISIGSMLGFTLAVASSIYSAYAKDAMTADAMEAAVKALNGLPEKQRMRESVFLQVLSSTIDDPNKVRDEVDSDGDGNDTEFVPNFQVCWDKRITWLKEGVMPDVSEAKEAIKRFFKGPVAKFQNAIREFLNALARMEVENPCVAYDDYGNCIGYGDGAVTLVLRALENAGYDVSFWIPGPSAEELKNWKNWDPAKCADCEPPDPPSGYDELDYTIDYLNDFNAEVKELKEQNYENLAYSWEGWVPWFYDPYTYSDAEDPPGGIAYDYYHSLDYLIKGDRTSQPYFSGLNGWKDEIERIRLQLPRCIYGYCAAYDEYGNCMGGCVKCSNPGTGTCGDCIVQEGNNPPCQWHPKDPNFGTIDTDFEDEFKLAQKAISDFIEAAEGFRKACSDFYSEISRIMEPIESQIPTFECGLTGINPVTYFWHDSRCPDNNRCHSISVFVHNFHMPRLVKRKYGSWVKGEVCIELVYYTQKVTVQVNRQEPKEVSIGAGSISGLLGTWNPFSGRITRVSTAKYRGIRGGWVRLFDR